MTDNVLQRAVEKRRKLIREMEELDHFITIYRRLQADEVPDIANTSHVAVLGQPGGIVRQSVEAASANILRKASYELSTIDILNKLLEIDIHVGGKNPTNNLASVLSKNPEVENIRGKGWRIRLIKKETEEPNSTDSPDN